MSQQLIPRLEEIDALLLRFGRDDLFIVADLAAYKASGAQRRLAPLLGGYATEVFGVVGPNPQIRQVEAGVVSLRRYPQATVLAIGGGTAIDTAKSICHGAAQDVPECEDATRGASLFSACARPRGVPLIAVPTTAGTGSEATHFAVLYVDGIKHSIAHASMIPDAVVLDATLTASLPADVAAASGLDAVAQAIESLWSVRATHDSMATAEKALRLGLRHLEPAVNRPTIADRKAMLEAAHQAGQAINVSRTTAPHALSYTLTSKHGVPHGIAVAMCLTPFMRFNGAAKAHRVTHPNGVDGLRASMNRIAAAFGVVTGVPNTTNEVALRWQQLLRSIQCPTHLRECGIQSTADLETIVSSVNPQRLANNPVSVSELDLRQLIREIA